MDLQTIIEGMTKFLFYFGCSWRIFLCFTVGVGLGIYVSEQVSADPLRWILAGLIIIFSLTVGTRWEASRP